MLSILAKLARRSPTRHFYAFMSTCVLTSMLCLKLVSSLIDYTSDIRFDISHNDLGVQDQEVWDRGVPEPGVPQPRVDMAAGEEDELSRQLVRDERREKLLVRERHLSQLYRRTQLALLPGFGDGNLSNLHSLVSPCHQCHISHYTLSCHLIKSLNNRSYLASTNT